MSFSGPGWKPTCPPSPSRLPDPPAPALHHGPCSLLLSLLSSPRGPEPQFYFWKKKKKVLHVFINPAATHLSALAPTPPLHAMCDSAISDSQPGQGLPLPDGFALDIMFAKVTKYLSPRTHQVLCLVLYPHHLI